MTVGSSFLAEDKAELSVLFVKYERVCMVRFINAQFLLRHFVNFHASRAFFTYKLAKVGWWLCLCCVSEMQHFIVSQLIRKLTEEEEAKKLSDMRNGLINNQYV